MNHKFDSASETAIEYLNHCWFTEVKILGNLLVITIICLSTDLLMYQKEEEKLF